jgi:predicted MFS family arabinose efflux permease
MRAVAEWAMLGDCAPSEAGNIATAFLSIMFNVGAAFGAVVAGVLSVISNVQTIFRLAAITVLSGVSAVTLTKTRSKTVN